MDLRYIVAFGLLSVVASVPLDVDVDRAWRLFKTKYQKSYRNAEEEAHRRENWMENMKIIERQNMDWLMGKSTYTLSMNSLGDKSATELARLYAIPENLLREHLAKESYVEFVKSPDAQVPESVDWRRKGFDTPVKNQGRCASCYAFAAAGALEGQYFIKTGELIDLSEQQIVDCSTDFLNHGCDGGNSARSYLYIKGSNGITTEAEYPYTGVQGDCRNSTFDRTYSVYGFTFIPPNDEEAFLEAIATKGPVAAVMLPNPLFKFYDSGVFECADTSLKGQGEVKLHVMLIIGYGVEDDGVEYFLVKNSWGPSWGNEGYVKIRRNVLKNCGLMKRGGILPVI